MLLQDRSAQLYFLEVGMAAKTKIFRLSVVIPLGTPRSGDPSFALFHSTRYFVIHLAFQIIISLFTSWYLLWLKIQACLNPFSLFNDFSFALQYMEISKY